MKGVICLFVMVLVLTACEGGPEYRSQAEGTHENSFEWVLIDHHVLFPPNSAQLDHVHRAA